MLIDVSLVWLSFMKQGHGHGNGPLVMTPSQILVPVRPYHSAMSTQYFGFVRHTVITNDVIEREK